MEHQEEIDWAMFTDKEVAQMSNPNKDQMASPVFLSVAKEALDEHVRRRLAKKKEGEES